MKLPDRHRALVDPTQLTDYLLSMHHPDGRHKASVQAIMIRELDCVTLTVDLPEHGLVMGSVGTIVFVYREGQAFEAEFVSPAGETLALVTSDQVRRVASDGTSSQLSQPTDVAIGNTPNDR